MFRSVLAGYLMVVLLAGPQLCCCTIARLPAKLSPETPQSKMPPATPNDCCCCHHDQGESSPPEDQPEQSPSPGKRDCPCQKQSSHDGKAFFAASETGTLGQARHVSELLADFLAWPAGDQPLLCDGLSRTNGVNPSSSFLTPREMLRALHVLRC